MKRFKDEARETMPEGATPLDPKDLEQKGLFSQNILLKGDVIELPDELSSDDFCEGKPFKTRVKNKETGEIEDGVIRPTLIFVHRNGAPIWMPLGNFLRGNRVHNASEYREAAEKHPINTELLRAQHQGEAAKILCTGKTLEVVDFFDGKFARFEKNVVVEGKFDIKRIPLFTEK